MRVHQLPDRNVMRMSSALYRFEDATLGVEPGSRAPNYAAMVNAMVDPGAIDDSDPTAMRRAVALALVRYPARFAELVYVRVSSPAEQSELVFLSLSHAPDLPVL